MYIELLILFQSSSWYTFNQARVALGTAGRVCCCLYEFEAYPALDTQFLLHLKPDDRDWDLERGDQRTLTAIAQQPRLWQDSRDQAGVPGAGRTGCASLLFACREAGLRRSALCRGKGPWQKGRTPAKCSSSAAAAVVGIDQLLPQYQVLQTEDNKLARSCDMKISHRVGFLPCHLLAHPGVTLKKPDTPAVCVSRERISFNWL